MWRLALWAYPAQRFGLGGMGKYNATLGIVRIIEGAGLFGCRMQNHQAGEPIAVIWLQSMDS